MFFLKMNTTHQISLDFELKIKIGYLTIYIVDVNGMKISRKIQTK
jgi:hypothetical protein